MNSSCHDWERARLRTKTCGGCRSLSLGTGRGQSWAPHNSGRSRLDRHCCQGSGIDPFVVSPNDVTRVRSAKCIEHAPTSSSIGQSSLHCRDKWRSICPQQHGNNFSNWREHGYNCCRHPQTIGALSRTSCRMRVPSSRRGQMDSKSELSRIWRRTRKSKETSVRRCGFVEVFPPMFCSSRTQGGGSISEQTVNCVRGRASVASVITQLPKTRPGDNCGFAWRFAPAAHFG